MSRKRIDELGSLQRAVMEVLWRNSEATVHDVRDALTAQEQSPAYTTILTVLQKLEKAGWVGHRRDGRTYRYVARRTREQEGATSLRSFIDHVFRGDPLVMFQHLISDDSLQDNELATLRQMIDRKVQEQRRDD